MSYTIQSNETNLDFTVTNGICATIPITFNIPDLSNETIESASLSSFGNADVVDTFENPPYLINKYISEKIYMNNPYLQTYYVICGDVMNYQTTVEGSIREIDSLSYPRNFVSSWTNAFFDLWDGLNPEYISFFDSNGQILDKIIDLATNGGGILEVSYNAQCKYHFHGLNNNVYDDYLVAANANGTIHIDKLELKLNTLGDTKGTELVKFIGNYCGAQYENYYLEARIVDPTASNIPFLAVCVYNLIPQKTLIDCYFLGVTNSRTQPMFYSSLGLFFLPTGRCVLGYETRNGDKRYIYSDSYGIGGKDAWVNLSNYHQQTTYPEYILERQKGWTDFSANWPSLNIIDSVVAQDCTAVLYYNFVGHNTSTGIGSHIELNLSWIKDQEGINFTNTINITKSPASQDAEGLIQKILPNGQLDSFNNIGRFAMDYTDDGPEQMFYLVTGVPRNLGGSVKYIAGKWIVSWLDYNEVNYLKYASIYGIGNTVFNALSSPKNSPQLGQMNVTKLGRIGLTLFSNDLFENLVNPGTSSAYLGLGYAANNMRHAINFRFDRCNSYKYVGPGISTYPADFSYQFPQWYIDRNSRGDGINTVKGVQPITYMIRSNLHNYSNDDLESSTVIENDIQNQGSGDSTIFPPPYSNKQGLFSSPYYSSNFFSSRLFKIIK